MTILSRRKESIPLSSITKVGIVGLIVALSSAYINTIWAVYINSFVNNISIVGFISGFLALIAFISYFLFIPLVERSNKARLFITSLVLFALTYILFAINKNFYLFIVLAIIMTLLFTLRITSFGLIVTKTSKKEKLSQSEGLVFTFTNLAWALGPLIAGYFENNFGINSVFILSAFFCLMSFILFKLLRIRDVGKSKRIDENIIKNFFDFFKDKKRVFSYVISAGTSFWWSLIYIFMPVYIIDQGFGDLVVAYFLFAVCIPLVLLEYKFGDYAGKFGAKKMFKIGFCFVALMSFICFFLTNLYITLLFLVIASIGMAMLEPTSEAYFFDVSSKENSERFYGPYKTSIDSGQFIGKIVPSIMLLFLPFKFIYLFFSAIMLLMFFISFKAKKIIEEK
ncbi:MAG: MFS transporter [Candidatus Pacearchaeota archaeon]|jgi:MFS family permease